MKSPMCSRLCTLLLVVSLGPCVFPAHALNIALATPVAVDGPDTGGTASLPGVETSIPGPLPSFLRMAGISQKAPAEEVMPLFAREVFSLGYERGRQTEFLVLLARYVRQARELTALAGSDGAIHISNCEEARPLLHIIGYRTRQDCGQRNTALLTADPERAFITIDSGFPLTDLEQTLQGGAPFEYSVVASRVPVLFTEADWNAAVPGGGQDKKDLIDGLLRDPELALLYWALGRMDIGTAAALRQSPGLPKLLPFASLLNFYGSHIYVRSGHVVVPGGVAAEPAWSDLVGANPQSPGEFVSKLLAKDKGWLVAYFDAMSRTPQAQQAHFVEAHQLKRCYEAFRSSDTSADAAKRAFRPAPALLLLLARMRWEPNGEPYVPGNLDVWKEILHQKSNLGIVRKWTKGANRANNPEQLLETMFSLSRAETDSGPLQAYLFASELDSRRPPDQRLRPETVRLLANKFIDYSNQYLVFSEFPELTDASITRFVHVVETIDKVPNHTLRGNTMGVFQANVGLWQVLARQGQVPRDKLNESWEGMVGPFSKVQSATQLFDAGTSSLGEVLRAATGKPTASQDEIINLLAGPEQTDTDGQRMHREVADRIRSILDGQRLVSLDTVFALGDGLNEMAKGAAIGDRLLPLAGELREFEMPRPIFTGSERTQWATGIYNNRHTDLEMRTDLSDVIKSPHSPAQLKEARGQLAPFLRDTLVGLNYAYYEPPGAQILHNNPLFVRSHDFSGETVTGIEHVWQSPQLFGEGSPAGGGAHLIGSLADLPYVLAQVEQDFIAPENVQALIWRELVPGLVTNATMPRWWGVGKNEVHAVALYQRAGEELLAAAADNDDLRGKVIGILSDRVVPQRLTWIEQELRAKHPTELVPRMMPADTFYLTAEFRRRFPGDDGPWGAAGHELDGLTRQFPSELGWERLSRDFGVPHPILAQSYARELLNVKPFPALSGFSSRLLAESWDSNNLYWTRLADEAGYSPVMLNRLVPQLTHRMVEKIFASDLEDWPAVLRAMQETGEEFRHGKMALLPAMETAPRP